MTAVPTSIPAVASPAAAKTVRASPNPTCASQYASKPSDFVASRSATALDTDGNTMVAEPLIDIRMTAVLADRRNYGPHHGVRPHPDRPAAHLDALRAQATGSQPSRPPRDDPRVS